MPEIIGVKFDFNPKVYYFSPDGKEVSVGDNVVVQTSLGADYGKVVMPLTTVDEGKIVGTLMPVLRVATEEDNERHQKLLEKRKESLPLIAEKIRSSGLEMKFVGAEYTFEGGKLMIYFTAEGRVDFRNLVRELATCFHTRIELKQIGARDECRMMGGIAPCGRPCCCADHMSDYAHVSIKMAKTQNLSLNPGKISGLCGRLMCCLAYENEYYAEAGRQLPKIGSPVTLQDGRTGTATATNPLKMTVRVRIENQEKETVEFIDCAAADLTFKKREPQPEPENKKGNNGGKQNNKKGKKGNKQNGGGQGQRPQKAPEADEQASETDAEAAFEEDSDENA
ncbi:MAG: stage 0 sporulation family protein [Clostridiales bacterium]|nr:stage 0 sporulation family protein [Clostridiales bacterium]